MTWSFARLRRLLAAALLLGVAVPLAGQGWHQPAAASTASTVGTVQPTAESQLLSLTNAARSKAGLPSLHSSTTLVGIARAWSQHLAATGTLAHNPSMASKVTGWSSLAENVAKAYSAAQAQSLFMGSPDHRANILDRHFNRIGIGIVRVSDGSLWITVDFEQTSGYTGAPPPKTAPAPPAPPSATARLAASRAAAASRANRSSVRRAVPSAAAAAARPTPSASADHTAALNAEDAGSGASSVTAGNAEAGPQLLAAQRLLTGRVPAQSPLGLVILAAVMAGAAGCAMAVQLAREHRSAGVLSGRG